MSRPTRVAHVATVDATLRFLLLPQLSRLQEEGYEVSAISAPGPWTSDVEARGIRHIAWPHATRAWDPVADARAFASLGDILRRERFHLVHTHTPKPGVMGRIAARVSGVPCVVNTVHGLYATPDDPPARRIPVLAAERVAARFSDLELYQSEEDIRWAIRVGVVDSRKAVFLGNGVDLGRFAPGEAEHEDKLRKMLGIPVGATVVGTVGRLVAEKGYRELLVAEEIVRAAEPEVRFLAVGPQDRAKADAIDPARLASWGVALGWRDDVRDLLALMDVFVLASWREGVPRSAIEAAAMAKPLVLTDIRGCRELVRHGREGFLVPRRDPRRLAESILTLIRDPALRQRMGARARARAVERFDERRVCDVLAEEYRSLLRAKGIAARAERVEGLGEVQVRRARRGDAAAMARYHRQHTGAFLPLLGQSFLRIFYLAQVEDPDAVAVVAERDGRILGCSTGVRSIAAFRRRFIRRYGLRAAAAAGARLLRPRILLGLLETSRYPAKLRGLPEAEVLFYAVDTSSRARRLGGLLVQETVSGLAERGAREVRVFIAEDNEPSNRLVRRLGFEPRARIALHGGEPSTLYVLPWPSS